jgi:hypothetical protein
MTAPSYSIIATTVLVPLVLEAYPVLYPGDKVACVVLPDGTFFVAVALVDDGPSTGIIRVWRLGVSLNILATMDLIPTYQNWSPVAYLYDGMKVALHNAYSDSLQTESWIIDCAATMPIIHSTGLQTATIGGYGGDDGIATVKLGNGMVLLANSRGVQVWDGLTIKGEWKEDFTGKTTSAISPSGVLWPKPSDPMVVALVGTVGETDPTYYVWFEITVTSDGVPTAVEKPIPAGAYAWRLAAGSPYLSPAVAVEESGSGPYDLDLVGNYLLSNASTMKITSPLEYTSMSGPFARLMDGKFVLFDEAGLNPWPQGYYGRLLGVDSGLGTLERLPLPYDASLTYSGGNPAVSLGNGSRGMGVDPLSGRIIAGATVVSTAGSSNYFGVQVWSVQGPANTPNLSGGPLVTAVYFT